MTDSFRLKVLKALTAALGEITTANGYQFDVAAVHRGRTFLDDNDQVPAIAINEKPVFPENLPTPEGGGQIAVKLELLVQGFAEDDRKFPTDPAYLLLADVQKCLSLERMRDDGFDILGFGERVTAIHIGQGVVRPPDAVVSDTAFFWLPVTLEFGESLNDPFA